MAKRKTRRHSRRPLAEPALRPDDLLHFIELKPFSRRWQSLGLDDEDDLAALQVAIMVDPQRGAVIKGTEGIRKMRFAPPRWQVGQRGAIRVLYVHSDELHLVVLCLAYAKNEADNISEAGKKALNAVVIEVVDQLRRRAARQ